MAVTLTDEQWAGAKKVKNWYNDCLKSMDEFGHEIEVKSWNERYERYDYVSRSIAPEHIKPFVLTGYAGSGKSYMAGAVIENLGLTADAVLYMAPTGKAAKVLTRKLHESGLPNTATTIHKAIYMPRGDKADEIDKQIESMNLHILYVKSGGSEGNAHFDPRIAALDAKTAEVRVAELLVTLSELMNSEGPKFNLKAASEISADIKLIVVDESSMVGTYIVDDLKSFGIPILSLGDPGQLSPVGDEWGFDMQNPDVFLSEIHRQAADNPIIRLATMARKGQQIPIKDYGDGVRVMARRNDDVTYNMERDAIVLVGTNRKRWDITTKIRKALGHTESGPMVDEPLMVCRNSSQHPTLVNGTMLRCRESYGDMKKGGASFRLKTTDDDGGGVEYGFFVTQGLFEEHSFRQKGGHTADDRLAFRANKTCEHVDWGHAITVHKSQGSEYDDVALHDESPVFRQDAQRWLYTGITRASKKLTVLV